MWVKLNTVTKKNSIFCKSVKNISCQLNSKSAHCKGVHTYATHQNLIRQADLSKHRTGSQMAGYVQERVRNESALQSRPARVKTTTATDRLIDFSAASSKNSWVGMVRKKKFFCHTPNSWGSHPPRQSWKYRWGCWLQGCTGLRRCGSRPSWCLRRTGGSWSPQCHSGPGGARESRSACALGLWPPRIHQTFA